MTPEQLAHAQELIESRLYGEAQKFLEKLHDPQAQEELAKLNALIAKIAQPFEMDRLEAIQKDMNEVQHLVQQQRLEEAKELLAKVHTQLNEGIPPPDLEDIERSKLHWGEPWNPSHEIFGYGIVFALLAPLLSWCLALNWRRLGKTEWVRPTQFIVVILILGMLGFIILARIYPNQSWIRYAAFILIGLQATWLGFLILLQRPAYQKWKKFSATSMYRHIYNFRRAVWQAGLVTIIVLAGCLMVLQLK